ncbi:MAG: D-alanyl-D-alanine carboxypeptidase [Deltaproteobacteria bacterium]|jgi:D-alanyl-D-alanine carboxypeptidase/D-alanyl-D-alanine-endopeptidase (penicillin-binding protein 4)|nr:D-alanyl-D-alanine carboxypeptidase [Deltaproteobacteria bacterium]
MAKKFAPKNGRHLKLLKILVIVGLALAWAWGPQPTWADNYLVAAKKPKKAEAKKSVKPKGQKPKPKAKPKSSSKTQKSRKPQRSRVKAQSEPDPETLPFPENVKTMAGAGAVLVADNHVGQGQSRELFSLNADEKYTPASILKVVTAGAALDSLGLGFRFRTDFYLDSAKNLWIVGRGDPFLVAEEICLIMEKLRQAGLREVKDIYLDSSYFESGLILDGNTFTNNPYDAYNLAIGVNFNTVNYLIDQNGKIVECHPCAPLTPITVEVAERNRPKKRRKDRVPREYRLNISSSPEDAEKNSGQMFQALLERFQITVTGQVIIGQTLPNKTKLIYSHLSSKTLEEMIKELLKHSNNYVTNQIFLTMGAEKYGAPATPAKAQQVVKDFLAKYKLPDITMVEGSGLSRQNSLTARQMARILGTLEPVRELFNSTDDGSVYYKTGTMSDIQTLAGYLTRPDRLNEPLSFVILLNGTYKPGSREKILKALKAQFVGPDEENAPTSSSSYSLKGRSSQSPDKQSKAKIEPPKPPAPKKPVAGAGLFAPTEPAL